jgi:hypothetical protein
MTGTDSPDKDLHDDIDQLAVEIEQKIAETQEFLDKLPDFAPRSQRSRKLKKAAENT